VREEPITDIREAMAFYLLEPFGDEWRQTARICQTTGSAFGAKVKEAEFMPTEMSRELDQTEDEMDQMLRSALAQVPNV
jgi:hypothetical protein